MSIVSDTDLRKFLHSLKVSPLTTYTNYKRSSQCRNLADTTLRKATSSHHQLGTNQCVYHRRECKENIVSIL